MGRMVTACRKGIVVRSLIKFELKKIFGRRVTQVALGVLFAFVLCIMAMNSFQQVAADPADPSEDLTGMAAIEQLQKNAEADAGPITDGRATEVIRQYKALINNGGADVPSGFLATHTTYLALVLKPWMRGYEYLTDVAARIDTTHEVDLYGQIPKKIDAMLADTEGKITYNDAEKAFWKTRAEGVTTPVVYGAANGWKEILFCVQFLVFALFAVALATAPVFNREYRDRTDAVILATKLGKTKLGVAKVVASAIAASIIYFVFALFCLFPLLTFGSEGAGLPYQITDLCNTFSLSMGGAVASMIFVGYLMMLGMLSLVLLLSAKLKSPMAIFAIAVALIYIPMAIPQIANSALNHILFLFPFDALDPSIMFGMVSYDLGIAILDFPTMVALVYLAVACLCIPLAIRCFNQHQVV